jgi:hypothetical protein
MFIIEAEPQGGEGRIEENFVREGEESEVMEEGVEPQISLHTLTGYTGPRTMRVKVRI